MSVEIQPSVKFVLFSAARSGTSHLSGLLRNHPHIHAHAEIFHPKAFESGHIRTENQRDELIQTLRELRTSDPLGYAYRVLGYASGKRAVGFKMWHSQAPLVAEALLDDNSIHKIVLERPNRLATYSSTELAKQTGVFNIRASSQADEAPPKIRFNADNFREHLAARDRTFEFYRSRAKGPVLELLYSEIEVRCAEVFSFLGQQTVDVDGIWRKMHGSDILRRFAEDDWAQIKEVLDEVGHPEWVSERD